MIRVHRDEVRAYILDREPEDRIELTEEQWEQLFDFIDDAAHEAACETVNDYICDYLEEEQRHA